MPTGGRPAASMLAKVGSALGSRLSLHALNPHGESPHQRLRFFRCELGFVPYLPSLGPSDRSLSELALGKTELHSLDWAAVKDARCVEGPIVDKVRLPMYFCRRGLVGAHG
jgi:hypothetical protein